MNYNSTKQKESKEFLNEMFDMMLTIPKDYQEHPEFKRKILVPLTITSVISADTVNTLIKNNDCWYETEVFAESDRLTFEEYCKEYCTKQVIDGTERFVYTIKESTK